MVAADLDLHKPRMVTDCANVVTNIRGDGLGLYGRPDNPRNQSEDGDLHFGGYYTRGSSSNIDFRIVPRSCVSHSIGRHVWFFDPPSSVCGSFPVNNE